MSCMYPSYLSAPHATSSCSMLLQPVTLKIIRQCSPACLLPAARHLTQHRPQATAAGSQAAAAATGSQPRSRAYPDEPRVGVGVVVFRRPVNKAEQSPEILMIRRAKEPAKGQWCFPGGSLELGESIAACAVREVLEETGLHIRNNQGADVEGFSSQLQQPIPFAAVDSIVRDEQGQLKFHYVVVEAAAMAADPDAVPVASDDVDGAQYVQVDKLRQLENLTKNCARIAEEAVDRFDLSY